MWNILHDNGKPIKFIGTTVDHRSTVPIIGERCEIVSYETAITKSQEWIDSNQFFCTAGHTQFSMMVVADMESKFNNINWVSIVHKSSDVSGTLGKNCFVAYGVWVEHGSQIGNNVRLCMNVGVNHDRNVVEDFVSVGPCSVVVNSHLEYGTWIGARAWIDRCRTSPYTVIKMNSRVYGKTLSAGTYFSHRKLCDKTTLNSDPHGGWE